MKANSTTKERKAGIDTRFFNTSEKRFFASQQTKLKRDENGEVLRDENGTPYIAINRQQMRVIFRVQRNKNLAKSVKITGKFRQKAQNDAYKMSEKFAKDLSKRKKQMIFELKDEYYTLSSRKKKRISLTDFVERELK